MFGNEMLVTSVEMFFYTQSIKLGLVFTFDFYKTNNDLIQSRKYADIVMPEQYELKFINPWTKIIFLTGFAISFIVYIVRFGILLRTKMRFIFANCDF